jgi:hypothetical protein
MFSPLKVESAFCSIVFTEKTVTHNANKKRRAQKKTSATFRSNKDKNITEAGGSFFTDAYSRVLFDTISAQIHRSRAENYWFIIWP